MIRLPWVACISIQKVLTKIKLNFLAAYLGAFSSPLSLFFWSHFAWQFLSFREFVFRRPVKDTEKNMGSKRKKEASESLLAVIEFWFYERNRPAHWTARCCTQRSHMCVAGWFSLIKSGLIRSSSSEVNRPGKGLNCVLVEIKQGQLFQFIFYLAKPKSIR